MIIDFFKVILVGICASAPVGPVLAFVLQTTFTKGLKAGSLAGYGAGLIDTSYSAIAICALGTIEAFILSHSSLIMIIGGALVLGIGLSMALKKSLPEKKEVKLSANLPLQTILMALSNPAAIAIMFALVAAFRINVDDHRWIPVIGVWIGTLTWWTFLPWIASKLGNKINAKLILKVNAIFGVIIMLFGVSVIVKGIIGI